ncbi:NAD-dependent epimerase/dehydratase family protein [Herbiconiux daphne]|uniref:NAD(P)-dependent oxidoreductase n=1 Tax=Herbiconiux daphne TaxID=2970914 RepID=A0ABT2H315_9MICO|nr:NAD(P)-dependent oxidoreductase [Herbiconiux daphne]MCS5734338.1 NAD(P)-dependent oxidoreductase [Herbiconiux daphne]
MRIVVTGSAGRLGRSVVQGLVASGHEVVGADRAASGIRSVDERAIDLLDAAAVAGLFDEVRPDAVVHLAAISVPFSAPELDILSTNTALGYTVAAAAAAAGVGRTLVASSPTVLGYGRPGWRPTALPLDEREPVQPANAYALSKTVLEEEVRMFARTSAGVFTSFRPCYVISPEEWAGAPTQQGHTVLERLRDPALAAVSLFNYVDARDAADFVEAWLAADPAAVDGECFFVGAADALAVEPVAALWRRYVPALGDAADGIGAGQPVFSVAKAERLLGWRPTRSWRDLVPGGVDAVAAPPAAHAPATAASTATASSAASAPVTAASTASAATPAAPANAAAPVAPRGTAASTTSAPAPATPVTAPSTTTPATPTPAPQIERVP